METKYNYIPAAYEVTVCDKVYHYALHSDRRNKIIYLSQVLNILEYVLFRKMKDDGFKPSEGLTAENFPFELVRMKGHNSDGEPWATHDEVISALYGLLQEYYMSVLKMLESRSDN